MVDVGRKGWLLEVVCSIDFVARLGHVTGAIQEYLLSGPSP